MLKSIDYIYLININQYLINQTHVILELTQLSVDMNKQMLVNKLPGSLLFCQQMALNLPFICFS